MGDPDGHNVDEVILQLCTPITGITCADIPFSYTNSTIIVESTIPDESVVFKFPNTVECTVDGVPRVMSRFERELRSDKYCRELEVRLPIRIMRDGMTFHVERLASQLHTHRR